MIVFKTLQELERTLHTKQMIHFSMEPTTTEWPTDRPTEDLQRVSFRRKFHHYVCRDTLQMCMQCTICGGLCVFIEAHEYQLNCSTSQDHDCRYSIQPNSECCRSKQVCDFWTASQNNEVQCFYLVQVWLHLNLSEWKIFFQNKLPIINYHNLNTQKDQWFETQTHEHAGRLTIQYSTVQIY